MTDGATRVVAVEDNVWRAPEDAAKAAYSFAGRVVEVELMPCVARCRPEEGLSARRS